MIPRKKPKKELFARSFGRFIGFGVGLAIFFSIFYYILSKAGWIPWGLGYFHVIGSILVLYAICFIIRKRRSR